VTGLHVAIIMDGNGRWASGQGLPRAAGHREGGRTLGRIVRAAPSQGVAVLTVYAFSADNWQRPEEEVRWLMELFRHYLRNERNACVANGVRLSVIGRRDRLPADLRREITATERATIGGRRLWLRVAVDYSARDAIVRAARIAGPVMDREQFGRLVALVDQGLPAPPVDLLIRSGGEQRLSDFLLWECAYAELHFTSRMWPDFSPEDLGTALEGFARRERRFGGLTVAPAQAGAA
jgi:undecaprenyl diphosphate synthase